MKRHLPAPLSALILLFACIGIVYAVGKSQPKSPEEKKAEEIAAKKISAPEITGTTIDGKSFRLSDLKGKLVLVNFWATWCGPCKMEIPDLIKLQQKYADRGFTIVGLSDDQDEAKVKDFVQQAGINYPILMMPAGVGQAYGVNGLPSSILLDRNGKVLYAMEGVDPDQPMLDLWSRQIDRAL